MGRRLASVLTIGVTVVACRQLAGLDDPIASTTADASGSGSGSCTTAGLTCAGVATAHVCGSACWVGCSDLVDEATAENRCTAWQTTADVSAFRSSSDTSCFRSNIQATGDAWIGFVQQSSAQSVSYGWRWIGDSQSPNYTNWASGQPNDGDGNENGAEQCAIISNGDSWQDVACSQTNSFSCHHSSSGSGGGGG